MEPKRGWSAVILILVACLVCISASQGGEPAFSWGFNGNGQVGDNTTSPRSSPVPFGGLQDVIAVSTGFIHSLALKSDGTAWACGSNLNGRLGDETTMERHVPVQVHVLPAASSISAGIEFSLAITADQNVWAWGRDESLELGDGGLPGAGADRLTPEPIVGLSNVVQISAGGAFGLALKQDGTVWAWGDNTHGQLGGAAAGGGPAQIPGLSNVIAVSAGSLHALALKCDGTVWAWGDNSHGQLGGAAGGGPAQIPGLKGVTTIAAGSLHSLASTYDGTVWAWGDNQSGQLGDGTMDPQLTPEHLQGLKFVVAVASGPASSSSYAILSDGSLWAWGSNGADTLGDGSNVTKTMPVPITGITQVRAIAGGFNQAIAATGALPKIITMSRDTMGNFNISGSGAPNTVLHVQTSAALSPLCFAETGMAIADANGAWTFQDTSAQGQRKRFYRIISR